MHDHPLIAMMKSKFGDFIINTVNDLVINHLVDGGLYVPFFPLGENEFGDTYNYLYVEDTTSGVGLDKLEDLVSLYFDDFNTNNRLLARIADRNLKNIKFYNSIGLDKLCNALEFKDTCGMDHMILALYSQDIFTMNSDTGEIRLDPKSYKK